MRRNVLPKLYEDAMLEPIRMGSNMAAGNQQKHLSLSLLQNSEIISLEKLKNIKIILGRHVNAASRKSLEIQA